MSDAYALHTSLMVHLDPNYLGYGIEEVMCRGA
jgi:hypothetical protein